MAKRDRLARDTYLALWIEKETKKRGARIVSAAGEGTDRDAYHAMVDAFATYERQMIGARTAAALQTKRQQGFKTGGDVPYGYRLAADGRLVEDADEQRVLNLIRRLREEGETLRAIGEHLKAQGYRSRKANAWHPHTIKRLLERAA